MQLFNFVQWSIFFGYHLTTVYLQICNQGFSNFLGRVFLCYSINDVTKGLCNVSFDILRDINDTIVLCQSHLTGFGANNQFAKLFVFQARYTSVVVNDGSFHILLVVAEVAQQIAVLLTTIDKLNAAVTTQISTFGNGYITTCNVVTCFIQFHLCIDIHDAFVFFNWELSHILVNGQRTLVVTEIHAISAPIARIDAGNFTHNFHGTFFSNVDGVVNLKCSGSIPIRTIFGLIGTIHKRFAVQFQSILHLDVTINEYFVQDVLVYTFSQSQRIFICFSFSFNIQVWRALHQFGTHLGSQSDICFQVGLVNSFSIQIPINELFQVFRSVDIQLGSTSFDGSHIKNQLNTALITRANLIQAFTATERYATAFYLLVIQIDRTNQTLIRVDPSLNRVGNFLLSFF